MALLLVLCFWLLLGCNLLRCVYHLGGFQNSLEASFYKAVKNQKPFAFYKGAENHSRFKNEGVFAALMVVSVT